MMSPTLTPATELSGSSVMPSASPACPTSVCILARVLFMVIFLCTDESGKLVTCICCHYFNSQLPLPSGCQSAAAVALAVTASSLTDQVFQEILHFMPGAVRR